MHTKITEMVTTTMMRDSIRRRDSDRRQGMNKINILPVVLGGGTVSRVWKYLFTPDEKPKNPKLDTSPDEKPKNPKLDTSPEETQEEVEWLPELATIREETQEELDWSNLIDMLGDDANEEL